MKSNINKPNHADSPYKLNWFEGFKRIKRVLEVMFIVGVVVVSGFRYFSDPYVQMERANGGEKGFLMKKDVDFAPEEFAKEGEWSVKWRGDLYLFPRDATPKEMRKAFKDLDGTNLLSVFKDTFLSIVAGIALIELCFWMPVYIARGFKKSSD